MVAQVKRSRRLAGFAADADAPAIAAPTAAAPHKPYFFELLGDLLTSGSPDAALGVLGFLTATEICACDDVFEMPAYDYHMKGTEKLLASLVSRARQQSECKFCTEDASLPVYGSERPNPLFYKVRDEIAESARLVDCDACGDSFCRMHALVYCEKCDGVVCSYSCKDEIGVANCEQYGCSICHVCARR